MCEVSIFSRTCVLLFFFRPSEFVLLDSFISYTLAFLFVFVKNEGNSTELAINLYIISECGEIKLM